MTFTVNPARFHFQAVDAIRFPRHAGNQFRGALGTVLPEMFAARWEEGPSGLRTPPRPFALRVAHLNSRGFQPSECFHAGVHLFDDSLRPKITEAFERLGDGGMGAQHSRLRLVSTDECAPVTIDMAQPNPNQSVAVEFVTPTTIRDFTGDGALPFGLLFRRIRDRISTLQLIYGTAPPDVDFRALAARADRITTTSCEIVLNEMNRKSSRTGNVHSIGGFTGHAVFAGETGEFLPWLEAAQYTGAGAKTAWGNGEIAVKRFSSPK